MSPSSTGRGCTRPSTRHGFLLSQAEQIEELQRLCEYVYVDPVLSEHGDGELFSTGLTAKVEALPDGDLRTPLARQRAELRALGHAFAAAVQGVRRSEELAADATAPRTESRSSPACDRCGHHPVAAGHGAQGGLPPSPGPRLRPC